MIPILEIHSDDQNTSSVRFPYWMLFIEHLKRPHIIFIESFVQNTDSTIGKLSRRFKHCVVDWKSKQTKPTWLVSRSIISDKIRDNRELSF